MSDTDDQSMDEGTEALRQIAEEVEQEREQGRSEFDLPDPHEDEVDPEAPADGPVEPLEAEGTDDAPVTGIAAPKPFL